MKLKVSPITRFFDSLGIYSFECGECHKLISIKDANLTGMCQDCASEYYVMDKEEEKNEI